jgi:trimeric autotransporter adhesin
MASSILIKRVFVAIGHALKRAVLLASLLAAIGFAGPASASVSCPPASFGGWLQGTSGAWAKTATLTADGLAKTCVNGGATTGPENFSIISSFAAPGPGPSPFGVLGLNFYANTTGNNPVLSVTCSAGCTVSGNGVYITGLGTATAGVSYVDITGRTVSAAVTLDANAISVSAFSITGGVYDATGPVVSTVSPATGSPAGGTAVTLTGSGFTGATALKFGTMPAQSFSVVSPTSISAVAPAGALGPVAVSVTSGLGSVSLPNAFMYVLQSQASVTVAASSAVLSVGQTSTISASGGSGTGAISYALTIGASSCALSGTTLTAVAPGICQVTATRAADATYAAASGFVMVSVSKLDQAALTLTAYPADIAIGQVTSLVISGGSGTGTSTIAVTGAAGVCSLTAAGTCTITVTKKGDSTYNPASATVDVNIGKTVQAAFSVSASPAAPTLGTTATVSTSGGSGTGTVNYRVANSNPGCTLSGTTVTMLSAAGCSIMAIKDGDATYASASASVSIQVGGLTQTPLGLTANPTSLGRIWRRRLDVLGRQLAQHLFTGRQRCDRLGRWPVLGLRLEGSRRNICTSIQKHQPDCGAGSASCSQRHCDAIRYACR